MEFMHCDICKKTLAYGASDPNGRRQDMRSILRNLLERRRGAPPTGFSIVDLLWDWESAGVLLARVGGEARCRFCGFTRRISLVGRSGCAV